VEIPTVNPKPLDKGVTKPKKDVRTLPPVVIKSQSKDSASAVDLTILETEQLTAVADASVQRTEAVTEPAKVSEEHVQDRTKTSAKQSPSSVVADGMLLVMLARCWLIGMGSRVERLIVTNPSQKAY